MHAYDVFSVFSVCKIVCPIILTFKTDLGFSYWPCFSDDTAVIDTCLEGFVRYNGIQFWTRYATIR